MTVEILLSSLLLITNILWALNTHRLINKIMSRSFFEYKEALKETKKENKKEIPNDFEDLGALDEVIS